MNQKVLPLVMSRLTQFCSNRSGATAVIYGICLMPLLAGVGFALDMTRTTNMKGSVQAAVDSAVLSSTRDLPNAQLTDAQIIENARNYFYADIAMTNLAMYCDVPQVKLKREKFEIKVTADCKLPTTMMGLVGVQYLDVSVSADAVVNVTLLDLALMLDISGSMAGTKMSALKSAATTAVTTLITPETGDRVRVALAPYAASVNIGSYGDKVFGPGFAGESCASERPGVEAFTDVPPASGEYMTTHPTACPTNEIVPLTYDTTRLTDAIDDLSTDGGTAGHLGTAWAWYLIAPDWDKIWPAASKPLQYSNTRMIKAVILMSDGAYNTEYEAGLGDSDTQARAMCDAMKAHDVLVFSVAFQAPMEGEAVLQYCATEATTYFDADSSAELTEAYKAISSRLSELRLTN